MQYGYIRKIFIALLCGLSSLSLAEALAESGSVVATINVGVNPSGIALTPDDRFAYVANNNNYRVAGADSVSVLDLSTNTLATTIRCACFAEPYTVTIDNSGTRAYVTNSNSSTISIIDIETNTVIDTIDGFDGPSGVAISADDETAYVNNYGGPAGLKSGNGKSVQVLDLQSNKIVGDPIPVDLAPAAIAISPDGSSVYTINYTTGDPDKGTVTRIDTETRRARTLATGLSGPFAIALSPNGETAYVTNFGSNNFSPIGSSVSAVDLASGRITATIELGIQPSGIAISPDGRYVYASNYNTLYRKLETYTGLTAGTGTINIIDTRTNSVVGPAIVVGDSPADIAVSSSGRFAYVTNYTSNTVSVIELVRDEP